MDPLIWIQARRTVQWLYDDLPTGTDTDEFETSLCVHLSAFLSDVDRDRPDPDELLRRVTKRAQSIYDDEVWQRHHTRADELLLGYMLELMLVNVLGYNRAGNLRLRVKQRHRLLASAVNCLPRTVYVN